MKHLSLALAALVSTAGAAEIPKNKPVLISKASNGSHVTDYCSSPAISDDGRYVAFITDAQALSGVSGPLQVVVLDRETGTYERVSRSTSGGAINDDAEKVAISADGRYVAYSTRATNVASLELGFLDDDLDIYRFDRGLQTTVRVSVFTPTVHADADCGEFDLSDDGRHVVFATRSNDLSPLANGTYPQIFTRDIALGVTKIVSLNAAGVAATAPCSTPTINEDGTRIVFSSFAANLGDPQAAASNSNIWLWDAAKTGVLLVSKPHHSQQISNAGSFDPTISPDGRWIAFLSAATNLVPNDPQSTPVQVYLFDIKKKKLARVPIKVKTLDEYHTSDLDLSRGAKHLTFVADDETYSYRALAVYSRATKATRIVTADDDGDLVYVGHHVFPAISANGKFIAFASTSTAFEPDPDITSDIFLFRRG
jgi:Tol biopolymer transport system component